MRILVTGSSGLVGSHLIAALRAKGHDAIRLVRNAENVDPGEIYWDPEKGELDSAKLEGCNAVVHLAGENIAHKLWTTEQKRKIRNSRIESTKLFAKALSQLSSPPAVFVSASAIGYYGDRGAEEVREKSPIGIGFLASLCREWEEAARPAQQAGIRVVNLRFGIVLSPEGGVLKLMLVPFRLGLGGPLGSGQQYMSWISIFDAVEAIVFCITNDTIKGPVNIVSPSPVTNAEFTKVLATVLGKSASLAVPAGPLRMILKGLADELMLASTRVYPEKLLEADFKYQAPKLEPALRRLMAEFEKNKAGK